MLSAVGSALQAQPGVATRAGDLPGHPGLCRWPGDVHEHEKPCGQILPHPTSSTRQLLRVCRPLVLTGLCYSSTWLYFSSSFFSRSCSTGFFLRHAKLTNPSGMSQGRNFPQKSTVTCSNSHRVHLALGQGSRSAGEDLTHSSSPPQRCSHRP